MAPDLALHVRYHLGRDAFGLRVGRLDIDPTSGLTPRDSVTLASNVLHTLHDAPETRAFVDGHGCGWWGDAPAAGWVEVERGERVLTLT